MTNDPAMHRVKTNAANGTHSSPRPIYAVWELTLACDMSCSHCGSRGGKARTNELATTEALDLVRQLADLGILEVVLIGGEAYLRDDWLEIARAVRAHGMKCSLTTGGRNMTARRAALAAQAGVEAATVSLDGLKEAHDRQRAPGSFDAAVAAIRHLLEGGVRTVGVNTQINKLSLPDLDPVLDLLDRLGCAGWRVQFTVAMGRAADHPEILLQPFDVLEVIPRIAALKRKAATLGIELFPGNNIGYFGPHEAELRGAGMARGFSEGCGAGIDTIGIEADGTIKGCPGLPTEAYAGGNIRTESLQEIWDNAAQLRFAREATVDDLWGFCRGCYYASVCRGGCTWTAHVLFGRAGNNPYCHHRALELKRQGLRERLIPLRAASGKPFDHGAFELQLEQMQPPPLSTPPSRC